MNSNTEAQLNLTKKPSFAKACLKSCQKLLAQLQKAKATVLAEFRETMQVHDHLVELAVNEAEALAWQTAYPHLLFPALAEEKAQAAVNWNRRQTIIRQRDYALPLAA